MIWSGVDLSKVDLSEVDFLRWTVKKRTFKKRALRGEGGASVNHAILDHIHTFHRRLIRLLG